MPHLLLADDDPELSLMLKEYLERDGFRVDTVLDGTLALKRALDEDFDLIILDVMMPGLNGLDVLRGLRAEKITPVLMLTARGEDVDSIIGLDWARTIIFRSPATHACWRPGSVPYCAAASRTRTAETKAARAHCCGSETCRCIAERAACCGMAKRSP